MLELRYATFVAGGARTRDGELMPPGSSDGYNLGVLGLAGESGEVADLVKKWLFHGSYSEEPPRERLTEELGDVLWYLQWLCCCLGITLDTLMAANMKKLRERYPERYGGG